MLNKIKHFYINKYLVSPISKRKYFISYDFTHKALWFRVYKAATRTIDYHFNKACYKREYVYSSAIGYIPSMYKDYFKFAFVRNPITRFISAWKDKVLKENYFHFNKEEYEQMKNLDTFIEWVKTQDIMNCDEHIRAQNALIDLNNVDFIGRFESFESDFHFITEYIGIKFDNNLHLNPTHAYDDIDIPESSLRSIAMIYEKDIRIFYPDELKKYIQKI